MKSTNPRQNAKSSGHGCNYIHCIFSHFNFYSFTIINIHIAIKGKFHSKVNCMQLALKLILLFIYIGENFFSIDTNPQPSLVVVYIYKMSSDDIESVIINLERVIVCINLFLAVKDLSI